MTTERQIRCDWSRFASIERPAFDNDSLTEFRYRVGSDELVIAEALLAPNGLVKQFPGKNASG